MFMYKTYRKQLIMVAESNLYQYGMSFTEFKLSGYAWNPKNLEIYTGDMVEWRWFFASYITGFTPRVVQVKDEVSTEELPGGFNSGAPAASGNFITVLVSKDIIYKTR